MKMIKPLPNRSLNHTMEAVYDKHAANMYGCIYKIVQNKLQAEEILYSVFEEFCKEKNCSIQLKLAPIWYIKYAMKRTFAYLKRSEISNEPSPLTRERIMAIAKEITPNVFAACCLL